MQRQSGGTILAVSCVVCVVCCVLRRVASCCVVLRHVLLRDWGHGVAECERVMGDVWQHGHGYSTHVKDDAWLRGERERERELGGGGRAAGGRAVYGGLECGWRSVWRKSTGGDGSRCNASLLQPEDVGVLDCSEVVSETRCAEGVSPWPHLSRRRRSGTHIDPASQYLMRGGGASFGRVAAHALSMHTHVAFVGFFPCPQRTNIKTRFTFVAITYPKTEFCD